MHKENAQFFTAPFRDHRLTAAEKIMYLCEEIDKAGYLRFKILPQQFSLFRLESRKIALRLVAALAIAGP